jgi:hypothetical protein
MNIVKQPGNNGENGLFFCQTGQIKQQVLLNKIGFCDIVIDTLYLACVDRQNFYMLYY